MPSLVDLLLAYGLCFGLQNKVEFLRSPKWPLGGFFDRLLSCSYCTGFHAGWLAWALSRSVYGVPASPQEALPAALWAFSSSAVCYLLDVGSQAAESVAAPKE
jgi:hypothetical protein